MHSSPRYFSRRRDVGDSAFAFRIGCAGEPPVLLETAKRIARRVTFAAMTRTLHEVLPAGELGVGGIDLSTRLIAQIQQLPCSERQADIIGERQIVRRCHVAALRQRLHEAPKVVHVLGGHPDIGAVGEGGIEMLAVLSDAARHGVAELRKRPVADADGFIGGDVGRIKRAEGALRVRPPVRTSLWSSLAPERSGS